MNRTHVLVSLLATAAIIALASGTATAATSTSAVDTTELSDIGYCKTGVPSTGCIAFGCTAKPGYPAYCGYMTCRLWTGVNCLLFA